MGEKRMSGESRMILYRNLEYQELFDDMCGLLSDGAGDACACAGRLIDMAAAYGFSGNLWRCFLAFCMASHENAYSVSCEISGSPGGSLERLAARDFARMRELFACDISRLDTAGEDLFGQLADFENPAGNSRALNRRIRDRIMELAAALARAEDTQAFQSAVTAFYREYGVGRFGLNQAFHVRLDGNGSAVIEPVTRVECVNLEDLVGYERQKQKLIENTEAFIEGRAANNVLLFGDSGTGKSSSIKAVLNRYYDRGLRMIEVYKHQFGCLSDVLEQIKDRNYRFIIYMDDLSFEDHETEYKYLKALIEGGLGIKPQNVLIYATSNRRHLIREKFSDKRELDDELHSSDTVQEKLSLAARFGVTIYYGSPDKKEFQRIVKTLAERHHIAMPQEELFLEANRWELSHGGLSGRTAAQFITYLLGR
jgi:predicted AAA+ superfamily ATPase